MIPGGRWPRAGVGWGRVRRHHPSKAAMSDNGHARGRAAVLVYGRTIGRVPVADHQLPAVLATSTGLRAAWPFPGRMGMNGPVLSTETAMVIWRPLGGVSVVSKAAATYSA